MSTPPAPPLTDAQRKVEDLEYLGRRLVEELDTLKQLEAVHTARADECEAAVVALSKAYAKLPTDATAQDVFDAKSLILAAELNKGKALEERGRLQPELDETPNLIAENEKALAELKAES
jgi:hypothetical protein